MGGIISAAVKSQAKIRLSAVNLTGTQAAGAYSNRLVRAVVIYLDFSDVGLPHSVGRAMRMGNLSAENNAFSANAALSHLSLPPSLRIIIQSALPIIPHQNAECKSFFIFVRNYLRKVLTNASILSNALEICSTE